MSGVLVVTAGVSSLSWAGKDSPLSKEADHRFGIKTPKKPSLLTRFDAAVGIKDPTQSNKRQKEIDVKSMREPGQSYLQSLIALPAMNYAKFQNSPEKIQEIENKRARAACQSQGGLKSDFIAYDTTPVLPNKDLKVIQNLENEVWTPRFQANRSPQFELVLVTKLDGTSKEYVDQSFSYLLCTKISSLTPAQASMREEFLRNRKAAHLKRDLNSAQKKIYMAANPKVVKITEERLTAEQVTHSLEKGMTALKALQPPPNDEASASSNDEKRISTPYDSSSNSKSENVQVLPALH